MAENDIIAAKEVAGGGLTEIALAPSDIGAAASTHSSTHHTGGTDALAAHQINGQTIFGTANATYSTDQTLTANRALQFTISNTNAGGINVTLPTGADGTLVGDTYVVIGGNAVSGPIAVRRINVLSPLIYETLATITATGQQYRFRASGGTTGGWSLVPVDSHTANHAAAGSDPLAPSAIGAQSLFETTTYDITSTGSFTLTAARAQIAIIVNYAGAATVTLPTSGNVSGDVAVVRANPSIGTLTVAGSAQGSETIPTTGSKRYVYDGSAWQLDPVYTHTHNASDIASGTLSHAQGGLAANVSSYNGLLKIASGSTSAVTVTAAGEALLDDADASAQRTTLGLGNSATLNTGTTAGTVATGDHTHADLHTRSHAITSTSDHTAGNHKVFYSDGSGQVQELALGASGEVLTSNGATSAPSFAAASGGIGGGTGSTDNAILRADGTGGATAQAADIVIDDATTSTQANVAIVNVHSEANSSIVLTPKGTGALIFGPKPAGTGTTGNARGAYAVDFGRVNFAGAYVASGTSSAIGGGENNQASGSHSCVPGGQSNVASGSRAFCAGFSNTASGNYSMAAGYRNTASGTYGATALGAASVADRQGMLAFSSGRPWSNNAGVAQNITHVLHGKTTTNAAVELLAGDWNEGTTRLTVPSGRVMTGLLTIVGTKSDGATVASYMRQVTIKNVGGTTSLVGTVNTVGTDEAGGTSIAITANDTNDALKVEATGVTSETWRWVCTANMTEMTYGS